MTPMTSPKTLLFLGGTAANNNWRIPLTKLLVDFGIPEAGIFNPVVEDWTPECQAAEDLAKAAAQFNLFYLANPQQEGNPISAYSIFEATCSLYDRPANTVVVFDFNGIFGHPLKAVTKIAADLVKRFPGAPIFDNQAGAIEFLVKALKGTA